MSTRPEVNAPETANHTDRPGEVFVDPSPYFNQWWEQMRVSRAELAAEVASEEGTSMSIESLPGSNCEVTFEGVLHFDGHSIGNIRSSGGALVVTKRGRVDADIDVGVAVINGAVVGNITASERVLLDSDALVKGQIHTPRLSMKPGAIFDGECVFTNGEDPSTFAETRDEEEELKYLMAGV